MGVSMTRVFAFGAWLGRAAGRGRRSRPHPRAVDSHTSSQEGARDPWGEVPTKPPSAPTKPRGRGSAENEGARRAVLRRPSGRRARGRGSGLRPRGAGPGGTRVRESRRCWCDARLRPRPVYERACFRGAVLQRDSETIGGTVRIPGEENHLRPEPGNRAPPAARSRRSYAHLSGTCDADGDPLERWRRGQRLQ